MTSAQVLETSVTNNSSSQNYSHPDDHTIRTTDTPGFKPFTKKLTTVKNPDICNITGLLLGPYIRPGLGRGGREKGGGGGAYFRNLLHSYPTHAEGQAMIADLLSHLGSALLYYFSTQVKLNTYTVFIYLCASQQFQLQI